MGDAAANEIRTRKMLLRSIAAAYPIFVRMALSRVEELVREKMERG